MRHNGRGMATSWTERVDWLGGGHGASAVTTASVEGCPGETFASILSMLRSEESCAVAAAFTKRSCPTMSPRFSL